MKTASLWELFRQAGSEWVEDKAPRLGAALAYYTVFALAPLLIVVIGIVGLIYGEQAAEGQVLTQFDNLVGEQGGDAIRTMVASAGRPGAGVVGTVLGIAMLLVGATGLFGQLQDALNTIWEVEPKPGLGIWALIRARFLSFGMILGIAFLLLVSLVVSAVLAAMASLMGEVGTSVLGHAIDLVVSLLVLSLLFAMIYRYLPDAQIAWKDVWLGAVVTAVLFTVGKFAIGLYLGHSGVGSAYGAAGSLAVLLVWIYYSAQVFLFGAELTQVYANRFGSRIQPAENAVRVTEEARAQQGIPHHQPAAR
jgi:membrane protein